MPWKETRVMDERMKFLALLLDGESMTRACEEFGVSRKTVYKLCEGGELPHIRVRNAIRIEQSDLAAYVERHHRTTP